MNKPITHVARPRRAIPGENVEIALLSEMVVALLGEVSILTERLDTVERLLDQGGLVTRTAIETFDPDQDARAERDARRVRQIRKVFRPLRHAVEREA